MESVCNVAIMSGALMLAYSRIGSLVVDVSQTGHALREAYSAPTHESLPADMVELTNRAGAKLRLVERG